MGQARKNPLDHDGLSMAQELEAQYAAYAKKMIDHELGKIWIDPDSTVVLPVAPPSAVQSVPGLAPSPAQKMSLNQLAGFKKAVISPVDQSYGNTLSNKILTNKILPSSGVKGKGFINGFIPDDFSREAFGFYLDVPGPADSVALRRLKLRPFAIQIITDVTEVVASKHPCNYKLLTPEDAERLKKHDMWRQGYYNGKEFMIYVSPDIADVIRHGCRAGSISSEYSMPLGRHRVQPSIISESNPEQHLIVNTGFGCLSFSIDTSLHDWQARVVFGDGPDMIMPIIDTNFI